MIPFRREKGRQWLHLCDGHWYSILSSFVLANTSFQPFIGNLLLFSVMRKYNGRILSRSRLWALVPQRKRRVTVYSSLCRLRTRLEHLRPTFDQSKPVRNSELHYRLLDYPCSLQLVSMTPSILSILSDGFQKHPMPNVAVFLAPSCHDDFRGARLTNADVSPRELTNGAKMIRLLILCICFALLWQEGRRNTLKAPSCWDE